MVQKIRKEEELAMEQLKVNDWITFTDISDKNPKQIIKIENGIAYTKSNKCLVEQAVKWNPEPGAWCWFFNDDRIPTISQFVEINEDMSRKYFAVYPNRPHALGSWYKSCEPFICELPSQIKDL